MSLVDRVPKNAGKYAAKIEGARIEHVPLREGPPAAIDIDIEALIGSTGCQPMIARISPLRSGEKLSVPGTDVPENAGCQEMVAAIPDPLGRVVLRLVAARDHQQKR
jgi:hypothetical protein